MKEIFWRFNLWQSMVAIVSVMDPGLDLDLELKSLAERHRGRGILNIDYDKIGCSFVWALDQLHQKDSEKFSQKIVDTWCMAWHVFASSMKVDKDAVEQPIAQPQPTPEVSKVHTKFSMEEVAKHNQADNLWLVIENQVYDLTKYFKYHPGGDMMLLGAGRDATDLFINNFHSDRAKKILQKYHIGEVDNNNNL
eukprot:TRINITY_DN2892_c0_g1_i2.p1 TRINITY_DN2892_c0_g1~~TRINITY_DN2892_c0_g1_i2.p1  ORF type:complete len:194 (-),score=38.52 TRINITY_DN2892_c0_g1_i2:38-619(-)